MSEKYKVSDQEIEEAFHNTSFGVQIEQRKYLAYCLLKIASGWHCGGTIMQIMQALGLIGKRIDLPVLTKKGKRFMWNTLDIKERWAYYQEAIR